MRQVVTRAPLLTNDQIDSLRAITATRQQTGGDDVPDPAA
jgi:hypothetical protein